MPFGYQSLFKNENQSHLFGIYIRINRQEQNLSLLQLADIVGITPSYLSAIEKGKKTPSEIVMSSLCDGLDINFDTDKECTEILNNINLFFRYCMEESNEVDKLYKDIITTSNYESFNFPYVLLVKAIYKTILLHDLCTSDELNLLSELCEYMDNSYQIAVLDLISADIKIHSDDLTLHNFYQENEYLIQYNQASNRKLGLFPIAAYSIHASLFYLNMHNPTKALYYCNIATYVFQTTICLKGLLAVKAIMSSVYLQLKQYPEAISLRQEILELLDDDSQKGRCLENIGIIYFQEHDYKHASNFFHDAISKNPCITQARYYILYILLKDNEVQNNRNLLKDISDNENLISFFNAINNDNPSTFNIFELIISTIDIPSIKLLFYSLIYEHAKKVNAIDKIILYSDKYIDLLKSTLN